MAMRLYATQLAQIALDVEKLSETQILVTEMMSAGHIIKLKVTDDQRDGRSYQVIGIYTLESLPKPQTLH
jgi:hypothetical protein